MLRFEHPETLYALWGLLPLAGLFLFAAWKKRRALAGFGDEALVRRLAPESSAARPAVKFSIVLFALAMLIVALANPQIGSRLEEVRRKGIDLVIALDVSNSMLAEDYKPNRLERARQAMSRLLEKLRGDRIGIVVFAGNAYVQLPITSDYAAARMFISTIGTDIIPRQGTAIGTAIRTAAGAFDDKPGHHKAIIVITDGENHEDDAAEAAGAAEEAGIVVHTVGMGSPKGAPIPVYQGSRRTGYRKDREGNTVVTRLNEEMLRQVAAAGGGSYIRATNTEAGLNALFGELEKLEKTETGSKVFTDYEDRFPYFIAAALILLTLELLVTERKSIWALKNSR